MAIAVVPLSDACGAEIRDVDLREPLDPAAVATIRKAWLDHLVILFRDQKLADEDQIRFAGYFGKVGDYLRPKNLRNPDHDTYHRSVMLITNIRDDQGRPIGALPDGEMMFHTDTVYDANPHAATSLYAIEIPTKGGHTLFSNQYMVYDALPARIRDRLAGRRAMNVFEFGTTMKTKEKFDRSVAPHYPHPVFRRHPDTGRLAVYVNELTTEEVVDFPETEGSTLLREIYELQREPRFVYEHKWRIGDLLMWDNRCTMHARTDFPRADRRLLRRVTIEGDRPV
ncbi:MAG: TauD/TfdA family dioxygenase [Alphaproteobacteria bacterium]|nr:TauD/TfdA family dioxygenase [Alphaproteobacteria bacterium]